jgi:hypothetical protein
VIVDDKVPVDDAGMSMLPVSAAPNEVWPLVLGKALLKVFRYACGSDGEGVNSHQEIVKYADIGLRPVSAMFLLYIKKKCENMF